MIKIEETDIATAFEISCRIPEFTDPYPWSKWEKRLAGKEVIALTATVKGESAGFKVGYRIDDHTFYSWVGGVTDAYRRIGVAKALAQQQEEILRSRGYVLLTMKTRNRFTSMLQFALGNGFNITGVIETGDPIDWRITLQKNL